MGGEGGLQFSNIKSPTCRRQALVNQNQANQQNETSQSEINRDLPRRCGAVSGSPDHNQQKRRNQRELVKRVKEKQVERCESAERTSGNQEKTRVKCALVLVDLTGEPNRSQCHDGGEQNKSETQSIDTECKMDLPVGHNEDRSHKLKTCSG